MKLLKVCLCIFFVLGFVALEGQVNLPSPTATSGDYLYWTDSFNYRIGRVKLDGTEYNPEFIKGLSVPWNFPVGIAVNEDYIYWTNWGWGDRPDWGSSIGRAKIDGTGVQENWITVGTRPWGLAIDDNYLYWGNADLPCSIGRATLNGNEIRPQFIPLTSSPRGIAVSGNEIYWGSLDTNAIARANKGGGEFNESWITDLTDMPHGVMVYQDHIYWANHNQISLGQICRAELAAGTNPELVMTPPHGTLIGLAARDDFLIWGSWNGVIGWSKLDGSSPNVWWIIDGSCGGVALTPERLYTFDGFFSPIDNPPTVNKANAGQAIPIKWRLTDKNGLPISDPASFISIKSSSLSCATLVDDPTSVVEEYAAGLSGLQYLGDGWWQFNWKTPKTYAGQCRTMKLTLSDNSVYTASFSFK